jgi:hypothetical protein
LEAVIATAAMDEAPRSAWCREQGLYLSELDGWKQDAIAGLGEPRAASAVEIGAGTAPQGQGASRNGRLACVGKKKMEYCKAE